MENSDQVIFDKDSPQWYVAIGEKWIGPMSSAEVYEKIRTHQLTLAHYVWRKGQPAWKRICDLKEFQGVVPHQPERNVREQVKVSASPSVKQASVKKSTDRTPPPAPSQKITEPREWYLHYNDSQFGPFTQEEIKRYLKIGKINLHVFGWKDGMPNWERLGRIQKFQTGFTQKSSAEQRSFPRRPLVAKLLISDDQSVIVGVCRDISVGGLQVLTDRIPGQVGTHLKMNISPSTNEAGNQIEPFVAEGVIVRILEDGRGFSFRFERLSSQAKQSIESFIESPV